MRVTPKSSREGVDGLMSTRHGTALVVRVRASADQGKANRAVEAVVADWLGVARSSVTVRTGGASRIKTLAIAADPAPLVARLASFTDSLH